MPKDQISKTNNPNNTQHLDYIKNNNTTSNNNHNINSLETPTNQLQMFHPQSQVLPQPNIYQFQYNQQPLQHNSQFNNISYPNIIHQRGYSLPVSQHRQLSFNSNSGVQHSLPNLMNVSPYNYPSSSANPNLEFMPPPAAIPSFQYSTALPVYSPRVEALPSSLYQYSGQNPLQFTSLNAQPMNMQQQIHHQNIQQQQMYDQQQQQLQAEIKPPSPNGSIKGQLSVQSLMNTSNSSFPLGAPYQMPNHEIYPKSSTAWLPKDDALLRFLKEYRKLGWREISMYFPTRTLNACQFRWRRLIAGVISNKKNKNKDKDKDKDKENQKQHKQNHKDKIKVEDKTEVKELKLKNKRNIEDDGDKSYNTEANGDNFKKIRIKK